MKNLKKTYRNEYWAVIPTKRTRFWRTCFLVQVVKFFKMNWKMMKIVALGHS